MSTDYSADGASQETTPASTRRAISSEVQRNTSGSSEQLLKISDLIQGSQEPPSEQEEEEDAREAQGEGQGSEEVEADDKLVTDEGEPLQEDGGDIQHEQDAQAEHAEPEPEPDPELTEPSKRVRLNPKDVAEKLGVSIKDVYAMGVPFGGELVPLGKLKDAYQDQERTKSERATQQARSIARENELMAKETQLRQMVKDVAHAIPPETAAKYEQQYKDYIQREQEAVFTSIPDWTDPAVLAADRKAIQKTLRGYGYGEAEIAGLHDHRLIKMIRDYTTLSNRIAALKKIKPKPKAKTSPKPGGTRVPQRSATADAVARAKRTGGRTDTIRAIGALIGKG